MTPEPGPPGPTGPADPIPPPEWFARPDPRTGEAGLRFQCTLCGRCCTGPEGFVLVSDTEADALAARLNLTTPEFLARYTRQTPAGRSLTEKDSPFGRDCIFLDREQVPGRAVCGVYQDRPAQCRTWPFWPSNVESPATWARTAATCPGVGTGPRYSPVQIRIQRDAFKI